MRDHKINIMNMNRIYQIWVTNKMYQLIDVYNIYLLYTHIWTLYNMNEKDIIKNRKE